MKHASKPDDHELLRRLQAGEYELLNEVYRRYRGEFVEWAGRRYNCTEADAADGFQDAVIVLYKNVRSGRLTELSSSLKTYLFAIGKHLVFKQQQRLQREQPTDYDEFPLSGEELDLSVLRQFDADHARQVVTAAMAHLDEKCREILRLFYYHQYPIESIQTALGMSSAGAVRVKKMRCLDELKALLNPR